MPEISPAQLQPRHIESQFAADPAVAETAIESGCTSVDSPDQLPESLRKYRRALPGLLFWHHPLGGGEATPQLRPDKPDEDAPKYIFPDDAGSVISITPSMQRRLDADVTRSNKVLIVEGTKQNIFAAAYAPDDVVVVGIQGCWGWSGGEAIAISTLDDLCKGRSVVVAFDADISSNQKVYDAAESLNTQLTVNGAKSVKFLKVPGSKKTGLDDYIARRPADNRFEPLASLIGLATPFAKLRKPPRVSSALSTGGDTFDFISDQLGEVIEAVFESIADDGSVSKEHSNLTIAGTIEENGMSRNVRRVSTLLRAAPRIVATVEEKDDLTPGAESTFYHDIQLQIGPKSSSTNYLIKDVLDKDLSGVRAWISRAGTAGIFASLGRGGQGMNGQARIAEAMRDLAKHSDVEKRTTLLRTGWYQEDDTVYWVDAGGAHGPDKKITTIKARLEGSVSSLDVPGFNENYTMDDVVASVKTMLGVCEFLYDPTPWITGISGMLWAIAGGYPDAVLYFVGGAGSGKSSITGALASMLGPRWGTGADPMASVEGTTAYLADVAKQIHNCPLILDDARDRSSSRSQENQDEALDAVIRVGYGGGGAARGRKARDASGNWHQSSASLNRPFVIIAGETLPDSAPQSTIERCLVVEVRVATSLKFAKDTTDKRSGLDHLLEVSRSGALQPMLSFFIHGMAKESTRTIREGDGSTTDGLDSIRQRFEKVRAEVAEESFAKYWPKHIAASQRVVQVTGTFLAGVSLLVEFISEFEILNETEINLLEDTWSRSIISAAASHTTTNLTTGGEAEAIINSVKGKIGTARYCLGSPLTPGVTSIGQEITVRVDGEAVHAVALIPIVVGEITGNKHNLARRLTGVLIPSNDGRPTRVANINGTSMRCLVIHGDAWYGEGGRPPEDAPHLAEDF